MYRYIFVIKKLSSVQFSSVPQSCPTLCNPMDKGCKACLSIANAWGYSNSRWWVGDAIQPSHSLSFPSSPAFNVSQQQDLFQWASSSHQVAKVLEFQIQHQSFQWIFRIDFLRTDWFDLLAVQGTLKSSATPQFKSINSLVLRLLYGPILTLEKP